MKQSQTVRLFLAAFFFLSAASSAQAQTDDARDKIETGFTAYLKDGIEAAMNAWLKGGPYDGDTKLISATVTSFTKAEALLGKAEAYEILRETAISPRTKAVLCVMYYPKGEEFFLFQIYRSKDGEWLVTNMESNDHMFEILPKDVIFSR